MSLSDDLRDELAQIAPARRCCRHAELSALFHASGAWHLRGGTVAVHLDLASSAVARRAFALLRDLGVRSEIRTYRAARSTARRATSCTSTSTATRSRVLREAGVLSASGAPLEQPPKRVVGRSCCRGAYLRGALLGAGSLVRARATRTSRSARAALDGARFLADVAAPRGGRARGRRAAHPRGRLREGSRGDRRRARARRRGRHRAAARGARGARRARAPTRTGWRTPTRRTSSAAARAAHEQLEAIRAVGLDALPPSSSSRSPSCGCATRRRRSRELAAKARPPITKAAAHRRLRADDEAR